MNTTPKLILGLLALLLTISACKDDPKDDTLNTLEGEWEVKSYTINGDESIGSTFTLFEIEFEEYETDEGDFTWFFIYTNGDSERLDGEYECNAEGDELELTFQNNSSSGGTLEFDMEIEDDELELKGNISGDIIIINAEK